MPPVRYIPDLVYREVPGFRPLELDLYRPAGDPVPVIVYLHGGGWRRGSRRAALPVLGPDFYRSLAARGFAVAAADYRLSGEARFPAPLEDTLAAIGWVREHAAGYGLDGGQVYAWGDSAGGHLALLAALAGAGLGGVVAWFPVTDLAGLPDDVAAAGGVRDAGPGSREALLLGAPAAEVPGLARRASPVAVAQAGSGTGTGPGSGAGTGTPPVLLMHGDADDMVPPAQSIRLAEVLRAAGTTVELELVPGATHMWKGASDVDGIVERSVEFLRSLGRTGPFSTGRRSAST